MKVVHIVSADLWAGAEVQAYTLMSALQAMDIHVHAVLLNEGALADRLRHRGIAVTVLEEAKMNALQILVSLRTIVKSVNPHIIHTHRIKENILGSIANLLSVNVPCVRTVHGASEHKPRIHRHPLKWLLVQVDRICGRYLQQRIVAVSEDLKTSLLDAGYPSSQVCVIENGVDIEDVRRRVQPVDFRSEGCVVTHVGIVGRLVPVKRIDLFLDIAKELFQSVPGRPWRFHIFGDGPLKKDIASRVDAYGLGGVVTLHGFRSDVIACIAALDVLVICSDHEGMPMNALEAMAVGTPIVAHAVGGLVNALAGGDGVRLVRSQEPSEYVRAVNELLMGERRAVSLPRGLLSSTNADAMRNLYADLISRGVAGR